MFTGIIEKVGEVIELSSSPAAGGAGASVLVIRTGYLDLTLGESVAVNGTCLTVTETQVAPRQDEARFFVSQETLRLTNLSALEIGSRVNLERALTLGTRLSGHLVQGHVDGMARFLGAEAVVHADSGEVSQRVRFELPAGMERYCVHKGSIAVNGVSLTLNRVEGREIEIMLIPHTWNHTNLSQLRSGAAVNIEVDLMAKYAEKLLGRA